MYIYVVSSTYIYGVQPIYMVLGPEGSRQHISWVFSGQVDLGPDLEVLGIGHEPELTWSMCMKLKVDLSGPQVSGSTGIGRSHQMTPDTCISTYSNTLHRNASGTCEPETRPEKTLVLAF